MKHMKKAVLLPDRSLAHRWRRLRLYLLDRQEIVWTAGGVCHATQVSPLALLCLLVAGRVQEIPATS